MKHLIVISFVLFIFQGCSNPTKNTVSKPEVIEKTDSLTIPAKTPHDVYSEIRSIDSNLSRLTVKKFSMNDTGIHIYYTGNSIEKITAELSDKNAFEFYYKKVVNELTSQSDMFCCKISDNGMDEYNFFSNAILAARLNMNRDTLSGELSLDEFMNDRQCVNMYNLSQKSLNLFSVEKHLKTWLEMEKIKKILNHTDSLLPLLRKEERNFEIPDWPIYGSITLYSHQDDLLYLHVSYAETDWAGANTYIYLNRGKIIYSKTVSITSLNEGVDEEGMQKISNWLAEKKERFYSGNKVIGWMEYPLFTNKEWNYGPDENFIEIVPEISFYDDRFDIASEFSDEYWQTFAISKLTLGEFNEKYEEMKYRN